MKPLLTAFACIAFLTACEREEAAPVATEPVATEPVVVAPVEPVTPAATVPPATAETEVAPATTTTPAPGTGASGSSLAGATAGGGDGWYVVKDGDTLWDIAERNNIDHGNLAEWNNITEPRDLEIGMKLRLTAP